jgi:hypothetical protein
MAEEGLLIEEDEPAEEKAERESVESTFVYSEDADNLVEAFLEHEDGRKALRLISRKVCDDYKSMHEGSEEYRSRIGLDLKLFTGDLPAKDYPFQGCANGHVPIMLENVTRLAARMMGEIYGDGTNVFGVTRIGPDDGVAEVLAIHGNWQINNDMPDFFRQMERSILCTLIIGDVTAASCYDEARGQNRHDILTPDEFFVPFTMTSTMPDYSDCPHMVRVLFYQRHDLQAQRDNWVGVDEVLARDPPNWDELDPMPEIRFETARSQHIEIPDSNSSATPYRLLQFEGWDCGLMPNQERDRYIKVIVDEHTGGVMLLAVHEKTDWKDEARLRRENAEHAIYEQEQQAHEDRVTATLAGEPNPAGLEDPVLLPPVMPPWMKSPGQKPKRAKKKPVRMNVHGTCIENLTGNLGLGYGRIQADFNRAADTLLNQFSDQATLNNVPRFIHSADILFPRPMQMGPGGMTPIEGISGDDLSKLLQEVRPGPANPQLMELIKHNYEWGQSSMQAPSVLSGEAGKSGETWRGMASRIEQATKQLSFIAGKYARTFLKQILLNNAELNALFLPEFELRTMFDYKLRTSRPIKVKREMYQGSYNIEIRADMRFATQAQKIGEADELVQLPQSVLALQQNWAFQYAVIKGSLQARGRDDLIPMLGSPPPNPEMFGPPPAPPGQVPAPPGTAAGQGPGGGANVPKIGKQAAA